MQRENRLEERAGRKKCEPIMYLTQRRRFFGHKRVTLIFCHLCLLSRFELGVAADKMTPDLVQYLARLKGF